MARKERLGSVATPSGTRHLVSTPRWSREVAGSFVHQFLVTLSETEPVVWRRIQVPGHYSFWDLHVALQDAMGWKDRHPHEFVLVDPRDERVERIGMPAGSPVGDRPRRTGWKVRVDEYVATATPPMLYLYDFGDEWNHTVTYEGTSLADPQGAYPRCTAGARRCPPEDCGGPDGYRKLLAILADPRHPEYGERRKQIGAGFDANAFDCAAVRFEDPELRWHSAFARRR